MTTAEGTLNEMLRSLGRFRERSDVLGAQARIMIAAMPALHAAIAAEFEARLSRDDIASALVGLASNIILTAADIGAGEASARTIETALTKLSTALSQALSGRVAGGGTTFIPTGRPTRQ